MWSRPKVKPTGDVYAQHTDYTQFTKCILTVVNVAKEHALVNYRSFHDFIT